MTLQRWRTQKGTAISPAPTFAFEMMGTLVAARPVRRHLFGDHTPLSEELIRDGLDRFTFDRHPIPVTRVVIAMLVIGFFCAIGWFFFGYA